MLDNRINRVIAALGLALGAAAGIRGQEGEGISLDTRIDLSLEYKLRSDDVLVEDYMLKSGIDLQREYFDREPLARYAASLGAPRGFAAAVEATIRGEWTGDYFKPDNLPPDPASGNPFRVDNYFVTKGVLYYRAPNFLFALGRDRVDYSQGIKGSLLPCPRLPYLDNARADARIGPLSINWMVASIQNRRSWEVYANGAPAAATRTMSSRIKD
jgi:hypothetical protein